LDRCASPRANALEISGFLSATRYRARTRAEERGKIFSGCVVVQGQSIQATLKKRLNVLGQVSTAERLRLALMGARAAAFDWTLADDTISWEGALWAMPEYGELARLDTGNRFCAWLPPQARARLMHALDDVHPDEANFRL